MTSQSAELTTTASIVDRSRESIITPTSGSNPISPVIIGSVQSLASSPQSLSPPDPLLTSASVAAAAATPAQNTAESGREGFGNRFEFLLSCLGLSVSLGNIWRFPTRAYENGGSAFLIPYLTCGLIFGLPAIYMEFVAGQYQTITPPIVFRRIMPILEGIGWMSSVVSACVAVYFIAISAWVGIYIINIFKGHMNTIHKCDNVWNNPATCIDMFEQKRCQTESSLSNTSERLIYINGSCTPLQGLQNLSSATEQYFNYHIINPSGGMLEITGVNWPIFGGITICWILTALLILKGVKFMGKISYVTVGLPYVLIIILAIRGVTLDGASDGLYYYFGKPDFAKLFSIKTWTEALKQLCFSLALGYGGLMSMASYSDRNNNCFRNAIILLVGDTSMSIAGGTAVFAILGFLAKERGVAVPEVVESGLSLAFVVYPEAMTQLWWPPVWMFLFFFMLFLLAISSEIAMVEVFCSCIYDQVPSLREKKWLVVSVWCFILYMFGLIFSTNAGFYWFQMYDEYAGGFSSVITTLAELIAISWCYGRKNFQDDVKEMLPVSKNPIARFLGPHSPYYGYNWKYISPVIGVILMICSVLRQYPYQNDPQKYPVLFDVLGWMISLLPVFIGLGFSLKTYNYFRSNNRDLRGLFMLQKQHLSYFRIVERYDEDQLKLQEILPDAEPWEDEFSEHEHGSL